MDYSYFHIGDRLELKQYSTTGGRPVSDTKYGSMLHDFDGVRTVKLSMPITEGRLIPLEVGDIYELCFFTSLGLYQCRGRIEKRYVENNVHMMDVLLLTELKKFQRRKFYRLDCVFPVKFRIISKAELSLRGEIEKDAFENEEDRELCEEACKKFPQDWLEGTVSDISGGGLRLSCPKKIERDTKMEVALALSFSNGIIPMKFIMNVLSCTPSEKSLHTFQIRGEFENVKDTDRETVIRYVFEEQRRRLRKES